MKRVNSNYKREDKIMMKKIKYREDKFFIKIKNIEFSRKVRRFVEKERLTWL